MEETADALDVVSLDSINRATKDEVARQGLINLRFQTEVGNIAMSGTDAILRILVDQISSDRQAGFSTAALLTGYRGSPLGGVDIAYQKAKTQLVDKGIHYLNSVNEELAATTIWGTQLSTMMNDALFDGVLGMWYGKAPGLDRSGDAMRHGILSGADPKGGVLCVVGDDPECKSSTIPSATEGMFADMSMPVLYPGSIQEIIDYGRYGYAISRASGLWSGLKIVTDIADAYASAEVGPSRIEISDAKFEVDGMPFTPSRNNSLLPPTSHVLEEEFHKCRKPAAKWFLSENPLHKNYGAALESEGGSAELGIVVAGKGFYDVFEALSILGLEESDLVKKGIRIHKPAVITPLDARALRDFAKGLKKVFVIEEKVDVMHRQVCSILFALADHPQVVSRKDERGETLMGSWLTSTPEALLAPLSQFLGDRAEPKMNLGDLADKNSDPLPRRIPYYCSGCPHNRSTSVPEGSVAGGGIGCHTMSLFMPHRQAEGITQMGGEGAQWIGASKFVKSKHRFQNIGDGTFMHSGSLAIRQAMASDVDITFKLLYNDAVAMTGGQVAAANMSVPDITQLLHAEGVRDIVVVADDIYKYPRKSKWAPDVTIRDRKELDEVQREMREIPGVSVLIYDQACAAEVRRKRKRGQLEQPKERVYINEDVCEGCGDCSKISNCLSLFNVNTALGEKVQIHQESCNVDLTCMEGNCPSFVTVETRERKKIRQPAVLRKLESDIEEPKFVPAEAQIMSVGIGGTGVLTVNQMLATAAFLDGKFVSALDQTGISQKGGTVASHLKVSTTPQINSNRIASGQADAILMFDILAGSDVLPKASADRTIVVGSTSEIPTGEMVAERGKEKRAEFPTQETYLKRIESVTKTSENLWVNAEEIARQMFKSQPAANTLVMGIAYQKGLLPATAESIEKAIRLNAVDTATNIGAFRMGRKIVADPTYLESLLAEKMKPRRSIPVMFRSSSSKLSSEDAGTLDEIISFRKKELTKYQSRSYAEAYSNFVSLVRMREAELCDTNGIVDSDEALTKAVAVQLHRLMAYKDEYEVARLSLKGSLKKGLTNTFGKTKKLTYHLQPPSFSSLGLKRKIAISGWVAKPLFRVLTWLKPIRGTPLDVFGYSKERRLERKLIDEYRELILDLLAQANPESENPASYEKIVEIANLAGLIKGFDTVKLANIELYRTELKNKLVELASIEKEEVLLIS